MFALGLLVGIYSYLIFILGIIGIFNKYSIFFISLIFIFSAIFYFYKKREDLPNINIKNKKIRPFLLFFLILAVINFIGALAPEYSFDAVWYHLSLPKIFLEEGRIFTVANGLFYYSAMPKLGEMLFTPFVSFNLEVFAKLAQWLFGILTSVIIYKIARRYFDEKSSFFAVFIFYGSLIVAWESTVAYVDLIRAFFEILALWGFLIWTNNKDKKIFIESAIFIGLAISTKLLAMGSLIIFGILIIIFQKNKLIALKDVFLYVLVALVAVSPWLIVAYFTTGNPIYPVLSDVYPKYPFTEIFSIKHMLFDHIKVFTNADILISPIYIIFLPLVLLFYHKFPRELKIISVYTLIALVIWYFIPRTGGGRFMIPYLPAMSILCIAVIENIGHKKIKKYSYLIILFIFVTTIFYRGFANVRHIPVVIGLESKDKFLSRNLNFNFGDFYDTDGYFRDNIDENDKVLLYGFHNIYYVEFPFVHESYVRPGDTFNYIAVQNSEIPLRFGSWKRIYINETTGVSLFTDGGKTWEY